MITQPSLGDMGFLKRQRFICEKQINERFMILSITVSDFIKFVKLKVSYIPLNLSNPAPLFLKYVLKSPINIMFSCSVYVCVFVYVCLFPSTAVEGSSTRVNIGELHYTEKGALTREGLYNLV